MNIKLSDVYRFRYSEEFLKNKVFDFHWCFDGQLVVKENKNGLYLQDTYWGFDSFANDGRKFTLEEALEKGTLTFVCNLDDVEKCTVDSFCYYSDDDLFDLSYQSGCYKKYCIKKGAKKSAEKMKAVLTGKIENTEYDIKWATSNLERYKEKLQEVENGNLDIYI